MCRDELREELSPFFLYLLFPIDRAEEDVRPSPHVRDRRASLGNVFDILSRLFLTYLDDSIRRSYQIVLAPFQGNRFHTPVRRDPGPGSVIVPLDEAPLSPYPAIPGTLTGHARRSVDTHELVEKRTG